MSLPRVRLQACLVKEFRVPSGAFPPDLLLGFQPCDSELNTRWEFCLREGKQAMHCIYSTSKPLPADRLVVCPNLSFFNYIPIRQQFTQHHLMHYACTLQCGQAVACMQVECMNHCFFSVFQCLNV